MKAFYGLAFAFIIIIAASSSVAEEEEEKLFTGAIKSENSIYDIIIEVPQNADIEQFSKNVISAISSLKDETLLDIEHFALGFLLWDNYKKILSRANKIDTLTNRKKMEFAGWSVLYFSAKYIVEREGIFKLYHLTTLSDLAMEARPYRFKEYVEISTFGNTIKPYVDIERDAQKRVETYNRTIEDLLN